MRSTWAITALLAVVLIFAGCQNEDDTSPAGNNPAGDLQIHGNVTDASGTELAGVSLHVVYDIEPPPLQQNPPSNANHVQIARGRVSLDSAEMGDVILVPLNNAVRISWTTFSEINNDYFQISRDGAMIASIQGAGSSATAHNYTYTDQTALNGTTYAYALSTVDVNGMIQEVFSDTATPCFQCGDAVPTEYVLHQNFPNPADDTTTIAFDLPEHCQLVLKVFNLSGAEIATLADVLHEAGRWGIDFPVSHLANGLYRYRLTAASYETEKMLLKNTTDYESLRSVPGMATTNSAGHFTFDAREGDTIVLCDSIARSLGTTVLDRAKIVALKAGYAPADTTVSLAGDTWHSLTFVLEALR